MIQFSGTKSSVKETTNLHNTSQNKQKRVFKIIVVGDSNVGKTCLTYRFCEGKFLDKSEATIGVDFRERIVDVNGEEIKVSRNCYIVTELLSKQLSLFLRSFHHVDYIVLTYHIVIFTVEHFRFV
jgi:Ras-related protein Rab-33B